MLRSTGKPDSFQVLRRRAVIMLYVFWSRNTGPAFWYPTHRKDFIIHVDDRCDFPSADLDPSYITCNGFDFSFHNEAASTPLVHSYYWDFGVPGSTTDTSNVAKPTFTFPDTGVYTVRFFVNKNEPCTDSAITQMSVFPGFFPAFNAFTSCLKNPVLFKDTTKTKYGRVSSWYWNFGDQNNMRRYFRYSESFLEIQ